VRMKQNSIAFVTLTEERSARKDIWKTEQIPTGWQKKDELVLILDRINDPGNLGTIIRIADWYGVSQIICSPDTVDCYNPKVLMATMGSFTRVSICYIDLDRYLSEIEWKIYGAYLDGENIHTKDFENFGWYLVIGSEAHGISSSLEKYITDKVTIPRFWLAESLNAGIATAVILDRIRG
jgi:TrmH family RNA methyltransferase